MLGDPAIKQSALYALAKLRAIAQAKNIAPLLQDRFLKGHAAKALALMNARKYASAIAQILKDAEPLNRRAASPNRAKTIQHLEAKRRPLGGTIQHPASSIEYQESSIIAQNKPNLKMGKMNISAATVKAYANEQ